ncbi:MAG: hypothetical protein L0G21_10190, partial [Lactococcus raffinolactis]|nr:hypothetical protein [Lactococcus raffinolactis]
RFLHRSISKIIDLGQLLSIVKQETKQQCLSKLQFLAFPSEASNFRLGGIVPVTIFSIFL